MPYKTPKMTPKAAARKRATQRAAARTRRSNLFGSPRLVEAGVTGYGIAKIVQSATKALSKGGTSVKPVARVSAKGKTKTVRTSPNSMTISVPGKGGATSTTKGREIATAVNKRNSGKVTYTSPPRSAKQIEAASKSSSRMKTINSKARVFKKAVGAAGATGAAGGFIIGQETQKRADDRRAMERKREEQRARNKSNASMKAKRK